MAGVSVHAPGVLASGGVESSQVVHDEQPVSLSRPMWGRSPGGPWSIPDQLSRAHMSRAVVQVALVGSSAAEPRMRCSMPLGLNRRSVRQLPLHGIRLVPPAKRKV